MALKLGAVPAGSETDPCCCDEPIPCADVIGEDLLLTAWDILACSICSELFLNFIGLIVKITFDADSGNGTFPLPYTSGSAWDGTAGTATVRYYNTVEDCEDENFIDEETLTIQVRFVCGDIFRMWVVSMDFPGFEYDIFNASPVNNINESVANTNPQCGQPLPGSPVFYSATGGFAILEVA